MAQIFTFAILNYNTTYHSNFHCESGRVFHGRIPHNNQDHKLGVRFNPSIAPTTDSADELYRKTKVLYDTNKETVMKSYINFEEYYDKKAKGSH